MAKSLEPNASLGLASLLGESGTDLVGSEGSSPVRVLVGDLDERDVLSVALAVVSLLPPGEDTLDPGLASLDVTLGRSSVDLERGALRIEADCQLLASPNDRRAAVAASERRRAPFVREE